MTARRLDAVLTALWLVLLAGAIARAWPIGFVAFFAFAAELYTGTPTRTRAPEETS